jgi:hypothetical protein
MSQRSLTFASRRLFLRNSGAAVLSGAAVALLADHDALAQSETMPQACYVPPNRGQFRPPNSHVIGVS